LRNFREIYDQWEAEYLLKEDLPDGTTGVGALPGEPGVLPPLPR